MGLAQLLMQTILVTGFLKSISGILKKNILMLMKEYIVYTYCLPFISVPNYVIRAKVNNIRAFPGQV